MSNQTAKAFSLKGETTQRFALLFLLGLSCFIALARFHTYDEPVEHDITTAAVIANEFVEAADQLHADALVEIGLVLFAITLLVNIGSRLLIWNMTRQRSGAPAPAGARWRRAVLSRARRGNGA